MKKDKRLSRCTALQILYSSEMSDNLPLDSFDFISNHFEEEIYTNNVKNYSLLLVKVTQKNMNYLDELICDKSKNWEINRIAIIDNIILRMAIAEMLFIEDTPLKVSIAEAIEIAKRNKYYQYENDLWIRLGFISNSLEGIGSIDNTDNQYFLNALELQKKYNLRSIVLYDINLYQEKFSKEFSAFLINNHHHTYFLDLNELWFYDALLSESHKAAFLHTKNLYYSYISKDPIYSYNSSIEEYKRAYNNFKKFYDLLEIENLFDGQKLEIKTTNWRVERNQRLFENNIDKDFCILLSTSLLYNLEEAERGEDTQDNVDAAEATIALIKETIIDLIELNEMEEAERLLEKIEPYAWHYESITGDSWHIDFYNGNFDNGQ